MLGRGYVHIFRVYYYNYKIKNEVEKWIKGKAKIRF